MDQQDHATKDPMGNAKYTALEHDGLEVVTPSEAPEVAQDEAWRSQFSKDRKSSLLKPEAVYDAPPYRDYGEKENVGIGKRDEEGLQHIDRRDEEGMQYDEAANGGYAASGKVAGVSEEEMGNGRSRRTYCCGMSRRLVIILIVVVILVVVLGAVLGGVLGTVLNKKSEPDELTGPLQTIPNTGLTAALSSNDPDQLLTYFQDPEGRILENSYKHSIWTLSDRTNLNLSVVTTAATAGSPLAALSYSYNNLNYRQIFFVTPTGTIMTANSTATISGTSIATSWSAARAISTDIVAPNSIGLAACVSEELMGGIRVFYPSQYGWVQELKYTFNNATWAEADYWKKADTTSGLACAVKSGSSGNSFLNLYVQVAGNVTQFWNDDFMNNGDFNWNENGPVAWSNRTIASGSDIAVAGDNSQTEYVYYQLEGGVVTRGIVNPTVSNYETFDDMPLNAAVGTKLTAAFFDGGSMLMYQNASSVSTIMLDNVSRYGAEIAKEPVP